jgi:hypothetical protein
MGTRRRRRRGLLAVLIIVVAWATAAAAYAERRDCDQAGQARDRVCAERAGSAQAPLAVTASATRTGDAGGYADPSSDLGAGSPTCRRTLDPDERRNCRQSGSVAHRYPLSSYGFDVRVGFSLTDMTDSFLGALQNVAALIWMGLVFLVKAVLLLLEWSFSLDLTARAMPEARRTLAELHRRAFGEPWLLAALSIAGLWGIWRGLVQRRTTETLGGLAATVGLMVCGLVVIAQPQATVGQAARLSNDAGTSVLAASRGVDVGRPRQALAAALADVFDATVRDPWCALEFGSVAWCDKPARPGARVTNGDLWLAYPAQSKERGSLFKLLKGEDLDTGDGLLDQLPAPGPVRDVVGLGGDDADLRDAVRRLAVEAPERAKLQEAGGTFPRFALLAVIAIGLLGAVALLGYLGVRLLLASALTLLLLLLAPAMLLAPAFGDAGRATFLAWAKRLVSAIAAKLIYAVFLAVVLAAAHTFTRLGIGWFGTWLVLGAFWWGVLLKRHEIVGFVSAGTVKPSGSGFGAALSHAYYAMALTRGARQSARSAAGTPVRAAGELRQRRAEGQAARAGAVGQAARERLDVAGTRALRAEQDTARARLGERDLAARELRALDRRLQGHDDAVVAARARGIDPPAPTREQQALLDHRDQLRDRLNDDRLRGAEDVVRHAQRNRAEGHDDVSPRDVAAHRARRRADLAADLPPNHERNLRAAGIDPDEYHQAPPGRRAELIGVVQRHLRTERDLLEAAGDGSRRPDPTVVRRAEQHLPRDELRRRTAEERARLRAERRQRRARAGVFRPR